MGIFANLFGKKTPLKTQQLVYLITHSALIFYTVRRRFYTK